jgi:exosortase
MVDRWFVPESYYSHGVLIPMISGYLIWQKRGILNKIQPSGYTGGLAIVALGLFTHLLCSLLKIYFVSAFSMILVISGLVLFFYGKEMFRAVRFPLLFLLTMIPLPLVLIANITVWLKISVAKTAALLMGLAGLPSFVNGNIITTGKSSIAIEAPCSGLRSLVAFITLGLIFAYFTRASYAKRVTLLLLSIPIAYISNVIRISMLVAANHFYGPKFTLGFFHGFTGYLVFAIAFTMMLYLKKLLEKGKKSANRQ